jgi:hypothetical protein
MFVANSLFMRNPCIINEFPFKDIFLLLYRNGSSSIFFNYFFAGALPISFYEYIFVSFYINERIPMFYFLC